MLESQEKYKWTCLYQLTSATEMLQFALHCRYTFPSSVRISPQGRWTYSSCYNCYQLTSSNLLRLYKNLVTAMKKNNRRQSFYQELLEDLFSLSRMFHATEKNNICDLSLGVDNEKEYALHYLSLSTYPDVCITVTDALLRATDNVHIELNYYTTYLGWTVCKTCYKMTLRAAAVYSVERSRQEPVCLYWKLLCLCYCCYLRRLQLNRLKRINLTMHCSLSARQASID
jgi:hypothetical protein